MSKSRWAGPRVRRPAGSRSVVSTLLASIALAAVAAGCGGSESSDKPANGTTSKATADTVKIGVVTPLSGPFAASGSDELAGAKLAVAKINAAGGIKSLGGAKLALEVADAGGDPEQATTSSRQVIAKKPVAVLGAIFSALTLAGTQVAEQKRVPWLTASASDELVSRGFEYTYRISDGATNTGAGIIETIQKLKAPGVAGTRLGILADNNSATDPLVELIEKELNGGTAGTVVDVQRFAPPLSDATPPVNAVLRKKPTAIFISATSTTDAAQLVKQLRAQRSTASIVMGASSAANPAFLDLLGADVMEGSIIPTPVSFPGKGAEEIVTDFVKATGKEFMAVEGMAGWAEVWIIAQALEHAGKADPEAVKEALDTMHAKNVPALMVLPGGDDISFAENGQRNGVEVELLQWQDGQPRVIAPASVANAEAKEVVAK